MLTIRIPFALPTLNEIIDLAGSVHHHRSGKRFVSYNKSKQQLTADIAKIAIPQVDVAPEPPVFVSCRWLCGNRRVDPDNIAAGKKFILDGFVKAGILKGDGWKHIGGFADTFEIGEPGVVVELRSLNTEENDETGPVEEIGDE
ncbi:MAG: Holliday junction resolvase [Gammaproteobacteria bacterium]|nr:Holliday junction resolvase [Gammaproteobacteria bacterium]